MITAACSVVMLSSDSDTLEPVGDMYTDLVSESWIAALRLAQRSVTTT
jgi:hypothetical protein